VALLGEVNEIFIFADDDAVLKFGVAANGDVCGVTRTRLEDVLAIESAIAELTARATGNWLSTINFTTSEERRGPFDGRRNPGRQGCLRAQDKDNPSGSPRRKPRLTTVRVHP
jgi:hypothetical protein